MARHNKAFPSADVQALIFSLKLAPYLGLAGITAGLGNYLGRFFPPHLILYLLLIAWTILIGLYIMEEEQRWVLFLFILFSFLAGVFVGSAAVVGNPGKTWSTVGLGWIFAIAGGSFVKGWLPISGVFLFPATMLYLVVWFLFMRVGMPTWLFLGWAAVGFGLFSLIGSVAIKRGFADDDNPRMISLAADLFIITYNLYWLGTLFWSEVV